MTRKNYEKFEEGRYLNLNGVVVPEIYEEPYSLRACFQSVKGYVSLPEVLLTSLYITSGNFLMGKDPSTLLMDMAVYATVQAYAFRLTSNLLIPGSEEINSNKYFDTKPTEETTSIHDRARALDNTYALASAAAGAAVISGLSTWSLGSMSVFFTMVATNFAFSAYRCNQVVKGYKNGGWEITSEIPQRQEREKPVPNLLPKTQPI